jgi:L-asparaginase II
MLSNPSLADVYRKDIIESCHRGSVIVVNHLGETVFFLGDVERDIYPRSSLKFFQAIPLVESGAADHFQLSDAEIALACSSHNAENIHTSAVQTWLNRMDLDIEDLENGPDMPQYEEAAFDLVRKNIKPTRVHQNCSGKHAGMLALAKFLAKGTHGYSEHAHGAQRAWMKTLSKLVDLDVENLPWERDGCGMPAIYMPMKQLALGCALFANPETVGGERGKAMQRIIQALQSNPVMVAGTDRCCSDVISATNGSVLVKTGAEAVYIAVLPEQGLGVALKIDDGSSRGSEVALGAVLSQLGAIDDKAAALLTKHFSPEITNSQGKVTGKVVPSVAWS